MLLVIVWLERVHYIYGLPLLSSTTWAGFSPWAARHKIIYLCWRYVKHQINKVNVLCQVPLPDMNFDKSFKISIWDN